MSGSLVNRIGSRSKVAAGGLAIGVIALGAIVIGNSGVSQLVDTEPSGSVAASMPDIQSTAPAPTEVPTRIFAPSASAVALESPPAGMVLYANLEDDYALWMPQDLAASVAPVIVHGIPRPGMAKFGKAEIGSGSEFTISIGTRDGRIRPCPHGYCDEVTVTSLDDLERALYTNPYYVAIVRESRSKTVLGGEPARTKEVRLRGLSWGPPLFTFVYSLHDGRPVVLTFDAWSLPGRGMLTVAPQLQMLSSFTFLDE